MKKTLHKTVALAAAMLGSAALAQAQQVLIPETQNWNFLHPMGVLPPRLNSTPDPDFETTWYLAKPQFTTNYDGPSFTAATIGDPLVPNSADSGPGAAPFAYGGVDNIAPATNLTLPASGNRLASYYRTTFIVPAGGLIEPTLRMVCDDGAYIYLDGNLITTVNVADGVVDTYNSLAADATNTELGFSFQLRTAGLQAGGSPNDVKVLVPVPTLSAGEHTLAVSVHNNALTSSDMGLLLELTALPPTTTTIHAVVSDVIRNFKGTPVDVSDDEFSFKVSLSGNNTGATWTSDRVPASGSYNTPVLMGPFSAAAGTAIVTFTASANPAAQTTVSVDPPTAFKTLVNYNQAWQVMNPLAGVLPPRPAGGEDTDFDSTWFLKANNFAVQYDGPTFGSGGVAGSYEAVTGPGPFAVGGVDGIAGGQPVGAAGTPLTLPPSGSRRASYYRTNFTTTEPMSLVTFDVLCDDGVYIYLDGNLVAQENMLDPAGYNALATAARGETLITTIDLSQPPGGNVIATVPGLAPGTHTLAVSLHQNALTSSDFGLALKMSGIEVVGQPVIEAVIADVVRSEAGTPGVPGDDTFTFKVTVSGANAGSTWKSNSIPASGSFGVVTTFGPFPVMEGSRTVQFSATTNPATVTSVTVVPPASSIAASVSAITRNNNGTPVDPSDDTLLFDVTVVGTFVSPEWLSNVATPNMGSYNVATRFGPFPANVPASIVINDSFDVGKTVPLTVHAPRYIPPVEMVRYNHTWKVMNPQAGVVPDGPVGPDDDFLTTWYLPETAFLAQYNGPGFGSGGVAGSYEAIQGPGPFAVGGIDGLAVGTTLGAPGTTLTLPATANRFTSYYRTTFTTATAVDNVKFDILCDDGVFIYLDGVLVAKENIIVDDTYNALAVAARAESLITTIDLSAVPGGNVVTRVTSVPAGTHTLAVSLHQSGADSSDTGLAITFYGRTATGVEVTPVVGTVTRTLNNTLTPADDTFSFPVTVTSPGGAAAGWTSNSVPAGGSYGVATAFGPFPVSESPKSITFIDKGDPLARATVVVTPPPIFGLSSFNGTVSVIQPTLPLPANWTANGGAISHTTNVGVVDPGTAISTQLVNLAGIAGPVLFRMDLALADTSATSNFEIGDTVLAELVLNNGTGEQRVNLISPFDFNGDRVLNGFTSAPADAATYNPDKFQDELNGAGANAEISANHTFALSSVIPDDVVSARVVVTVVAVGGSESVTVSNLTFTPYLQPVVTDTDNDGQSDASEAIAGTSPTNSADVLRISAIVPNGAGADLSFSSKSDRSYRLQISTRLSGGWVPFGDIMAGTGGTIAAPVPLLALPGQTKYFFRVQVVP